MAIEKVKVQDHITKAYMEYAVSTIVDRSLPDILDSLKPVHRRILWSMYKKGIRYNRDRAKSTEPVSETMKIHHHGDASIYGTIALLTEQNETLLHPWIDGEGAFGKVYSKDSPSAARYTYCRLNKFAEEMFDGIDKDVVHMYGEDKDHMQPSVLNCTYPSILIKSNSGIAVGEACNWGSFNLKEVCNATINYINDKDIDLLDYIKAPDFPTGASLIYNEKELRNIYDTGRGSIKLRAEYKYDKDNSCIDIVSIPYGTTVESIVSKISELDFKEILDVRDETGYNIENAREELKITIDVKKGTNIEALMLKLYTKTPLEASFSFNMNGLVNFKPRVLGIKEILDYWIEFRQKCIKKALNYDIKNKSDKLHILNGLKVILLDIDKAIGIIRNSKDSEIIKDLCNEFNIDTIQADNVANMKLKNINKEFILKQLKDVELLEHEVLELKDSVNDISKINNIIISELKRVSDTYSKDRKTKILYEDDLVAFTLNRDDLIEDYSTTMVFTKGNYIKKTLRYSDNQKVKDNDQVMSIIQCSNKGETILISNKGNAYKLLIDNLNSKIPSQLGDYIPTLINLEEEEYIVGMLATSTFKGYCLIIFENGKVAKIPLSSYQTTTRRSKLANSLNLESPVAAIIQIDEDVDIQLITDHNKALVINTKFINEKASRNTQGITVMRFAKGIRIVAATQSITLDDSYVVTKPGAGKIVN